MIFIETPIFTRHIQALLSDEEYSRLQTALLLRPEIGDFIPGSGGIRKVRWATLGRGKRGGARVSYYWAVAPEQILMLTAYPKNEKLDLTSRELKQLRQVVNGEYP